MSEPIISIKGLSKSYGRHQVLININMEINKGDIYGLVGKNGAGKTTLFKSILGLSDYTSGTIQVGNESLEEGRGKIGFMIGQNFFGYMTAEENLQYFAKLKNIKDKEEVHRVLKLVELDGVKTKVKNFSLGMKQRLGIANAVLGNPEILILDEPTNGLDPQGIADIRKLVIKLNEELGMTVIVSSHILGELQNTAHKFGVLNNGCVVKELTEEDLQASTNYVKIEADDLEKAREVLKEAGITIHNEKSDTRSLEDYYFELIGGSAND